MGLTAYGRGMGGVAMAGPPAGSAGRDRSRYIAPVLRGSAWWILAASLPVFAAAVLALPTPARASPIGPICTGYARGYDPFKAADVVAEGVLLSGPAFYGALLSPARFQIVRYLKGRGPRVIWVRTPQRQVATGDMSTGIVREFARTPDTAATPRAGEAYRIFSRTRGRHRKRRHLRGLIDTCTGDDRRISIRRLLRPVPRTLVRRRGGREVWSARLYRRRSSLRCLRLVMRSSHPNAHHSRFEDHGACAHLRRRRSTLVVTATGSSTTAVALAGKGLSGFTATRLSDGARVNATARSGVALALLSGGLERRDVGIVALYRDGSTRAFGGLERRASAVDPLGYSSWVAEHERAYPSSAGRRACVVVWLGPLPGRSGECGSTGASPFFFAIRRAGGEISTRRHTVVFGAISQAVTDLTVTGPDGPRRPAISRRGRSFIAVFAGDVPVSQLTLSFVLRDGRTLSYTGRREFNLAPPLRR